MNKCCSSHGIKEARTGGHKGGRTPEVNHKKNKERRTKIR